MRGLDFSAGCVGCVGSVSRLFAYRCMLVVCFLAGGIFHLTDTTDTSLIRALPRKGPDCVSRSCKPTVERSRPNHPGQHTGLGDILDVAYRNTFI